MKRYICFSDYFESIAKVVLEVGNLIDGDNLYGWEGDNCCVNSGTGWGRNLLEDIIPDITVRGDFSRTQINVLLEIDGTIVFEKPLVGRIAIRQYIENSGQQIRGCSYSKRQANNLLNRADFIEVKFMDGSHDLLYTWPSSLDAYVNESYEQGRETHRNARKKTPGNFQK